MILSLLGRNYWEKMQQSKIKNRLDDYCNQLESLSSQMAESFSLGNHSIIKTIDSKRKLILEEISKDLGNLSNSNKKSLELVWVNNNKLISNLENAIDKNKKTIIDKKKLFIAYTNNSGI